MADTTILPDEVITDDNQPTNTDTNPDTLSTSLQKAMWGDEQIEPPQNQPEPPPQNKTTPNAPDDTETFDEAEYLKKNFEVDSIDAIKAEREELKKLREQKPQEFKIEDKTANDIFKALQAGEIKKVAKILRQQEELEEVLSAEVTKDNAAAIIKMNMGLKNPDLSKTEIDFQFEQEYIAPKEPKEPKQRASETDDEFSERMDEYKDAHNDWKKVVDNIDMRKTIAAKMAKPDLASAKANIKFTELQQSNSAPQPTQEDLDNYKREQDAFTKIAESTLNDFKGFTTQVKNKDVDYAVGYTPSVEDKATASRIINQFVKDGYNPNAIFVERWVKEDGTLDVNQLTKDVLRIYSGDKAEQKIANDAANQRMELYLKSKKNVNLNNGSDAPPVQNNDAKNQSERLQEQFWGPLN